MDETTKPRILIVEDDPDLRKILSLQLQSEGFLVLTAENGQVAFEMIQRDLPDCVVLDLMMPVMDGFNFLKRIRTLDRIAQVAVVVLTASEDDRHRRKSELYLADAYINKPYDLKELTAIICRLCQVAYYPAP
jgi:DNA-binding response OmpR family regulator